MTNTIEIPLNKLVHFPGNVRKTHNKRFIAELAASIREHGLQQNLIVKPDGKNFAVVAGGQRLKALQQLAKEGDIRANYRVSCKIANTPASLNPSTDEEKRTVVALEAIAKIDRQLLTFILETTKKCPRT